jgi:transcriptional regulator with XRE-family HTH domain
MDVGVRIGLLLERRGMSQSELARRLGLRQSTINMLINGHTQSSKHLHRIARELGTTPAYLSGETDDPNHDAPTAPELSAQEHKLITIYRRLPKKDQSALRLLIERMAGEA